MTLENRINQKMRDLSIALRRLATTCVCGHKHDEHHRGFALGLETFNCDLCDCPEYDEANHV